MIRTNTPHDARSDAEIGRLLGDTPMGAVRYDCQGNPVVSGTRAAGYPTVTERPTAVRQSETIRPCGETALASACNCDPSLAMVYSPHQVFHRLYAPMEALRAGTLFEELNKPWKEDGRRC